jgi:hypothetical protein
MTLPRPQTTDSAPAAPPPLPPARCDGPYPRPSTRCRPPRRHAHVPLSNPKTGNPETGTPSPLAYMNGPDRKLKKYRWPRIDFFPANTASFSFGSERTRRARSTLRAKVPTMRAVFSADLPMAPFGATVNFPWLSFFVSRRLSTASIHRSRSASVMFRRFR